MNDFIRITEEMRNEKLEITLKDGYQFKDENGNIINATKIVLEKKKEPAYRPFKDKEECWAEMQKHQPFGWIKYKSDEALTCLAAIDNGTDFIRAYEKVTFADGTPFGIKGE